MPDHSHITVRALNEGDRPQWEILWKKYNSDKAGVVLNKDDVKPEKINELWPRLLDPSSAMRGFGAIDSAGNLVGFVHREVQPSPSGGAYRCYMEDLYSGAHGAGVAMMEALRHEALDNGWAEVHWKCHNNNPDGLTFYRGLQGTCLTEPAGQHTGFNKFNLDLDTPVQSKLPDLSLIDDWKKQSGLPGVGVVICDDSGIIFRKGYGAPKDAIIPIASLSKALTAVAILQLIKEGATNKITGRTLSLDDHLVDLLPMLDTKKLKDDPQRGDWMAGVTVKDALAHKTRMGRGGYDESGDDEKIFSSKELRGIDIAHISPEEPGYSNRAYNMLGLLVEDFSGKPFNQYIAEDVVGSRNLGEIYPSIDAVPEEKRNRILTGYGGENLNVPAKEVDGGALTPCGGFFATADAMAGFFHKLAAGNIFEGETAADETGLWAHHAEGRGWAGLGTQIKRQSERDNKGESNDYHVKGGEGNLYGHGGGINGFQIEAWHDPKNNLTVLTYRNGYWVPSTKEIPNEDKYNEIVQKDIEKRGVQLLVCKILGAINQAEHAPALLLRVPQKFHQNHLLRRGDFLKPKVL